MFNASYGLSDEIYSRKVRGMDGSSKMVENFLNFFQFCKIRQICIVGQHNDSRTNLALALTAIRNGATCLNHVEVVHLLKKTTKTGNHIINCCSTVAKHP